MAGPMTKDELERYAEMVVRSCIAFRRGDELLVRTIFPHRDLAVALTEAAYRAGAAAVDVAYEDNRVYAAGIRNASKSALGRRASWQTQMTRALGREEVGVVFSFGEFENEVLASLPPDRVAAATKAAQEGSPMPRYRREGRFRGTICCYPTEEWAARVYPGVDARRAMRSLARDLLWFCRLGPDDPPGHRGWTEHLALLRRRAAKLTRLDLKELEVRDHGTDLRLRIAPYSMWRGGGEKDHWGRQIAMNVPTEECFISPDAAATEGVFRCSRPRQFGGRIIEGLAGEFRGGRLVRLRAKRDADRDWLARYLAAIPNADRLGEIALVDSSSRIGQKKRDYYNALLDENAAAHMAFGSGFAKTRTVPIGRNRHGVNQSQTHIDVMIGTGALEAVGVKQNGRRVALVSAGVWQF